MDRDGVRIVDVRSPGARRRRLFLAVLAVTVGVAWLHRQWGGGRAEPERPLADEARDSGDRRSTVVQGGATEPGRGTAGARETLASRPPVGPRRARRRDPAAVGPERELTLGDVKPLLQGKQEGIGVFPLPGSDPPKSGLIVPEDFPLPEGYVRHYQTTDDGKALPPILMFHPDYEWVDDRGNPLPIPPDRVVPPELAPPGMPLRKLELPDGPAPREERR